MADGWPIVDQGGRVGGEVEDHFSAAAVLMAVPALGLAALAHPLLAGRMGANHQIKNAQAFLDSEML
jgi:hypothetical protein